MTFTSVLPDDPSFEDYTPGATYALGSIAVDEAEVVAFADPDKGAQGAPLSMMQGRKLKEISDKASGKPRPFPGRRRPQRIPKGD